MNSIFNQDQGESFKQINKYELELKAQKNINDSQNLRIVELESIVMDKEI